MTRRPFSMGEPRIERIVAHAALADGRAELEEATAWAADGDDDWQAWVDDLRDGLALVVRIDVVVEVGQPDATTDRVHMESTSIWVEKHLDPPKVEEQLREIAGKDFAILVGRLRALGVAVREADLEEMYVHVELDCSLREELGRQPALERGADLRPPGIGQQPDEL